MDDLSQDLIEEDFNLDDLNEEDENKNNTENNNNQANINENSQNEKISSNKVDENIENIGENENISSNINDKEEKEDDYLNLPILEEFLKYGNENKVKAFFLPRTVFIVFTLSGLTPNCWLKASFICCLFAFWLT